MVGRGPIWIIP